MTKCAFCKIKMGILKCKHCTSELCSNCIQLETHKCPQLNAKKQILLQNLESKLVRVVAPKVNPI